MYYLNAIRSAELDKRAEIANLPSSGRVTADKHASVASHC